MSLEDLFNKFQLSLEKENETRDVVWRLVKSIENSVRLLQKHLQIIHATVDKDAVAEALVKAHVCLKPVQENYKKIEESLLNVSTPPFYQYHDIWRPVTQKLTFVASLIVFLERGELAVYEEVATMLSMRPPSEASEGLALDLEDYLYGLLQLASELSRLAVNSVTHGDMQRPLQISKFVGELSAGFRLIPFKNDFLRKRYDVLKYDVRKIEEVVYDLSMRNIAPAPPPAGDL